VPSVPLIPMLAALLAFDPPTPEPRVGLSPVTEIPPTIAAPASATPDPDFDPGLGPHDPKRFSFLGDGAVLQRLRESWLNESLASDDDDLVSTLTARARAGFAFDVEQEPLFADRADIHTATGNPGDHAEQHFTMANLELSRGVFLRADGASRAFSTDRRYTTLSAEAYFSIGANAGMALGFDFLRAGIPGEDASLQDGLFARFIIDF